jgi:hypothetical protein
MDVEGLTDVCLSPFLWKGRSAMVTATANVLCKAVPGGLETRGEGGLS